MWGWQNDQPCCPNPSSISSSSSTTAAFSGSTSGALCEAFCEGGIAPLRWSVTISGVTSQGFCNPNECETEWNREFTMTALSECLWELLEANSTFCAPRNDLRVTIEQTGGPGNDVILVLRIFDGTDFGLWEKNFGVDGTVDCLSAHSLTNTNTFTPFGCANFPTGNLTITPT